MLEDNLRTPSGISYVIENRRAMTHVFPELFASHRVRRVADYPHRLLEALRATAPPGVDDPCVVVLTPGVHNAAYFEHSFLARQMGVELVEGRDLVCRDERVFMRTTSGEQRVDVVYRRIDDEYLDPLHFRPRLGARLRRASSTPRAPATSRSRTRWATASPTTRRSTRTCPAMIEYYLGEEPILANVETYQLEDPDSVRVGARPPRRARVKPVDGSGGYGLVIGPQADEGRSSSCAAKVRADPRGWIAQEPIALSTAPTYVDGRMGPRHLDLRPFAVNDGARSGSCRAGSPGSRCPRAASS